MAARSGSALSLQSRIFALFLALLLVVLGVTLYTVSRATYRHSIARAEDELAYGRRIFYDNLESRRRALAESGTALAKEDALRQAVFAGGLDRDSVTVALDNHRARTSADLALLVGLDGTVLADTADRRRENKPFAFPELLREPAAAESTSPASRIATLEDVAYQLVAVPYYVPVSAPRPSLWLVLGRALDDRFAIEMQLLLGADVAIVRGGGAPRLLASSLAGAGRATVAELADEGETVAVKRLAGVEMLVLPVALPAADGLTAVLLRPTAAALLDYRQLSGRFALVALGAAMLALVGALVFARGVARPIHSLGEAARRVA
ncbi:MAG TPA: cache domain-containing protein, partial [Kofleriaceae bacterium]